MSKGQLVRIPVPSPSDRARIDAAIAMYEANKPEVDALVVTLPEQVVLADKRVLKATQRQSPQVSYRCVDGMVVIASYDATPHGILKHISVSYRVRDPRWNDLKLLRAAFFADDHDVIQVLPRNGQYVNIHSHCFHLFQAPTEWQGGWFV